MAGSRTQRHSLNGGILSTVNLCDSIVREGANPTKSGRFVVRLPKSMHSALEFEAAREGVSLNQLVVAMLASKLGGGFTTIAAT